MNIKYLNKVTQGDCLKLMKKLPDNSVDLIIADPPYNENKADWDSIENYLEWWENRVIEFRRVLADRTGIFYFYQMNFLTTVDMHNICIKHGLIFKQMVIIDKGIQSVAGRTSTKLRSYPKATEYLLWYSTEDIHSPSYFIQIKTYMRKERKKIIEHFKFKNTEEFNIYINEITDTASVVCRHYFADSQWVFPSKEIYAKLQSTGFFERPFDNLKDEYAKLKKVYRYNFNLPYGITDVWKANMYKSHTSHPTEKPLPITRNIVKASSNTDDIVLIPFAGSGSECFVCKNLDRMFIGFEISKEYCKFATDWLKQKRMDDFTLVPFKKGYGPNKSL